MALAECLPLDIDIDAFERDESPTRRSSIDLAVYAREAETQLHEEFVKKHFGELAPLDGVPIFAMTAADLAWLAENPRAAAVVSQLDGVSTLRHILTDVDLPTLETMRLVCTLVQRGVIRFA